MERRTGNEIPYLAGCWRKRVLSFLRRGVWVFYTSCFSRNLVYHSAWYGRGVQKACATELPSVLFPVRCSIQPPSISLSPFHSESNPAWPKGLLTPSPPQLLFALSYRRKERNTRASQYLSQTVEPFLRHKERYKIEGLSFFSLDYWGADNFLKIVVAMLFKQYAI